MSSLVKQLFTLKKFFPLRELLSNASSMKKARSPIRGYLTTLCFWALMDIGLLDHLSKGSKISYREFAQSHQLNPNILLYICRYLSRNNYLKIHQDKITLSSKGHKFWHDVYGVFHLFYAYEPLFTSLSLQLKNESSFGKELSRRENEVAIGFAELGKSFMFKLMQGIIEEHKFKKIVELGCAQAELSIFLCEKNTEIECLGIDYSPEVIESAQKRVENLNLNSRIKLILADIFQIDKVTDDFSSYDLVTAIDLFHGYFWEGPENLISLFKKLKRSFPQSQFLISEICLPPHRQMRKIAYPYAEHEFFHDLSHQKSFASKELENLLQQAGFKIQKKWMMNKIAGRICLLLQNG
jgi:ubiquinone/menaquinone biosynthesis C-methylase UbiE